MLSLRSLDPLSGEVNSLATTAADSDFAPDFYFKQLTPGIDVAKDTNNAIHKIAKQMANFYYVVGDRGSKECILVDAAW